jgi:hypothetical protein
MLLNTLLVFKEKLADLDLDSSREQVVWKQLKYQVHGLIELINFSITEQNIMSSILASLTSLSEQYLYYI